MSSLTLDSHMLSDLYGGSDEDVRFILNDYLEKHDEIIASLNEAFKNGLDSLVRSVHFHSSTFSYIGVPQLTADCREFERECKKATDTSVVKSGFERLLKEITLSAGLVKQELARLEKI